jgi:hypothetical protein
MAELKVAELKAANWIGVNGDTVRSLVIEPECRTLPNPSNRCRTPL